jgi:hypothetical protein
MSWYNSSYMVQRGLAAGKSGQTHELTEAVQGRYHYVYGPYAEPVLWIRPGDIVTAETHDAFEGMLKTESYSPVGFVVAHSDTRGSAVALGHCRGKIQQEQAHKNPDPFHMSLLKPE